MYVQLHWAENCARAKFVSRLLHAVHGMYVSAHIVKRMAFIESRTIIIWICHRTPNQTGIVYQDKINSRTCLGKSLSIYVDIC